MNGRPIQSSPETGTRKPGNSPQQWYLYSDAAHDPFYNMALDEILLLEAENLGRPLIRIYAWDRPAVSIGYVQHYAAAPGGGKYTVVRRPTGGGAVWHDCDLTYTAVVPAADPICKLSRLESYRVFHRAVLLALDKFGIEAGLASDTCGPVDRATMRCFVTPTRYDVVAAGKKYAGAAQRRTKTGLLHQGSIALAAAGGRRELLVKELLRAFEKQFDMNFINFVPEAALLERAERLTRVKYATGDWNQNKKFERKNA
ncbi:MAG: hypothetical protein PHH77_04720 [Victivallaceae bacterium]|nr:hypothetical protein [Victivallaceae bacterium]